MAIEVVHDNIPDVGSRMYKKSIAITPRISATLPKCKDRLSTTEYDYRSRVLYLLSPHNSSLLITTCTVANITNLDCSTSARKLVDVSLVELPRRNLVLEKDVQLRKKAVPCLWQHKEHKEDEEDTQTSKEEASHTSPVPLVG
jgi:hypothetical protein